MTPSRRPERDPARSAVSHRRGLEGAHAARRQVRLPAVRAWLKAVKHRTGPKPGQGVGRPRRPPETAPAPAVPAE